MSGASARSDARMTVDDFLAWRADLSDDGRYELVGGQPVRLMSPTNIRHAEIQANAAQALRQAIGALVATIAQALGDTLSSDSTLRIVTIRRQNGTTAIFNAPLNEVRENGAADSHCFRHGRSRLPANIERAQCSRRNRRRAA